jgi:hypothetical protein
MVLLIGRSVNKLIAVPRDSMNRRFHLAALAIACVAAADAAGIRPE